MQTGGQQVLLPESTRKSRKSRIFRLELSSFDRNMKREVPNTFRWRFPNAIREVVEISLVGGTVPQPTTNINATRPNFAYNSLTVLFSGSRYTITIPVGNYNATSLAAALNSQLVSVIGGVWTTIILPLTGQISITGPGPFSFLFGSGSFVDQIDPQTGALLKINSPAIILGFLPAADIASGPGNIIIGQGTIDTTATTNRIYMFLNYDTTQDLIAYDRGTGRPQPTAIIYFDATNNDRKYLNKETYSPVISSKPAPIARIQTLDVVFTDFFGNPVNFGGREVSIALEITILEP